MTTAAAPIGSIGFMAMTSSALIQPGESDE
jgi:hypothetical protein